jgi:hypothetical protein
LRAAETGETVVHVSTTRGAIAQARLRGAEREALARSAGEGESVVPDSASPFSERAALLALQRSAGNQAVSRAVQRLRESSAGSGLSAGSGAVPGPPRNETGLPDGLKSGVESLSGVALDDVRVHYDSERPAQLGALAYAKGSEIHLGPGQEQHLPHEAWHVVQQAQGKVPPSGLLASGSAVNVDRTLEDEAQAMGERAAAVESTSCMLTAGDVSGVSRLVPPTAGVVQMVRHRPSKDAIIEYDNQVWMVKTSGTPIVVLVPHPGGGRERRMNWLEEDYWNRTPGDRTAKGTESDADVRTKDPSHGAVPNNVVLDEFQRAKDRAIEQIKAYLKERGQGNKEANRRKVDAEVALANFAVRQTDAQPYIPVPSGNECWWEMNFTDAGKRNWKLTVDVDTTLEESVQDAHVGFMIETVGDYKKFEPERRLGHVWINVAPVWRK